MRDRELYAQILGVRPPWSVTEVKLDLAGQEIDWLLGTDGAIKPVAKQMRMRCEEVDGLKAGAVERGKARRCWNSWATRCRLEPVAKVNRTVKDHLWGLLNAVVTCVTNATAESLNSKTKKIKRAACGFRNKARFKDARDFQLGGLKLHPGTALATETPY